MKKSVKFLAAAAFLLCAFSFASFGVSAGITWKINYAEERLEVGSWSPSVGPQYLYSLKAPLFSASPSDAELKKLKSEQWYPVYGGSIDISGLIPKRPSIPGKEYNIGLRRADDAFGISGYASRELVQLPARQQIRGNSAINLVKDITYILDADGRYKVSWNNPGNKIQYNIGLGGWINYTDDKIIATPEANSLGTSVLIRLAPDEVGEKFASEAYKYRIPPQPKEPKLATDDPKRNIPYVNGSGENIVKGVRTTMEASLDGKNWVSLADTSGGRTVAVDTVSGIKELLGASGSAAEVFFRVAGVSDAKSGRVVPYGVTASYIINFEDLCAPKTLSVTFDPISGLQKGEAKVRVKPEAGCEYYYALLDALTESVMLGKPLPAGYDAANILTDGSAVIAEGAAAGRYVAVAETSDGLVTRWGTAQLKAANIAN